MLPLLYAAKAIGGGLNAYGNYRSLMDQAGYLDDLAASHEGSAEDIKVSNAYNQHILVRERDRALAKMEDLYAAAGVELEGAPKLMMGEEAKRREQHRRLIERDAKTQIAHARSLAAQYRKRAEKTEDSAKIGMWGDIFSTVGGFLS